MAFARRVLDAHLAVRFHRQCSPAANVGAA